MSEERLYRNDVPDGYEEERCEFHWLLQPCGLPAWEGATEDEPRCMCHTKAEKPADIKAWLEAAVEAGAQLGGAKLCGTELWGASLDGANLEGANLSGANLKGAGLSGAYLWDVDLACAQLGGANLACAELGRANLAGARLDRANLSGAYLWNADLSGATCLEANLCGTGLNEANLSGARLWRATCAVRELGGIAEPTSFGDADLRGAKLRGVSIAPGTGLNGARFGRCPLLPPECRIYDELLAETGEPGRTYAYCARVYRQLKQAYQQAGDYDTAGEYFLHEKRCLRRRLARENGPWWRRVRRAQRLTRIAWWLYEVIAGYGERPSWVAGWGALLILVCALLQGWLGIGKSSSGGGFVVGPGFAWPSWAGVAAFGKALYFSIITFTTTGYGDMHPSDGAGQFVAAFEALSGAALLSLFLVCIVRKFSR